MTLAVLQRLQDALTKHALSFLILVVYVFTVLRVTCVLVSSAHTSHDSTPARTCDVFFWYDKGLTNAEFQSQIAFWILTMMVALIWAVMTIFVDFETDIHDYNVRFIWFICHEMRV